MPPLFNLSVFFVLRSIIHHLRYEIEYEWRMHTVTPAIGRSEEVLNVFGGKGIQGSLWFASPAEALPAGRQL